MTIQVDIQHMNPGYNRKLRVRYTDNDIPREPAQVIEAGEKLTVYVHTGTSVIIEETE